MDMSFACSISGADAGAGADGGVMCCAFSTSLSISISFSFASFASFSCFLSFLFSIPFATILPATPNNPFKPDPSPSPPPFPAPAGKGKQSTTRSAFAFASASPSSFTATSCFHPIHPLTVLTFALQTTPITTFSTPTLAKHQSLTSLNRPPVFPLLKPSPATNTNSTPRNPVDQFGPRKGSVFLNSRWRSGMGKDSSERITVDKTRIRDMWWRVHQNTPKKVVGISVDG